MAALTLDTLILQVRKEILEPGVTTGQWDNTELTQWLQEANDHAVTKAEIEALPATFNLVAGQEAYATADGVPSDLGSVRRVELQAPGALAWTPMVQVGIDDRIPQAVTNPTSGLSVPYGYFFYGGKIFFVPVPSGAYVANLFYYKRANTLTSGTDVSILDARFHRLLKYYCIARAKQKSDDPGYTTYDSLYANGVRDMLDTLSEERHTEGPRVVREV